MLSLVAPSYAHHVHTTVIAAARPFSCSLFLLFACPPVKVVCDRRQCSAHPVSPPPSYFAPVNPHHCQPCRRHHRRPLFPFFPPFFLLLFLFLPCPPVHVATTVPQSASCSSPALLPPLPSSSTLALATSSTAAPVVVVVLVVVVMAVANAAHSSLCPPFLQCCFWHTTLDSPSSSQQ